jgi:hypothetical protein
MFSTEKFLAGFLPSVLYGQKFVVVESRLVLPSPTYANGVVALIAGAIP